MEDYAISLIIVSGLVVSVSWLLGLPVRHIVKEVEREKFSVYRVGEKISTSQEMEIEKEVSIRAKGTYIEKLEKIYMLIHLPSALILILFTQGGMETYPKWLYTPISILIYWGIYCVLLKPS